MFENIKAFLNGKEFNESLKHDLFVNYIKIREVSSLNDDDMEKENTINSGENNDGNENNSNLFLLFNKKEETDMQKECNGLILEKNTNKVVCACQNVFESEIPDGELIDAEYCEDGTVLRLYYYNNKWTVATRKCIDAKYSYWSSKKTFNDMFWELFENVNLSSLNRDCTYLFVLLHNENNFIVKHHKNSLVYTGCINNVTCQYVDDNICERFKINMQLPDKIQIDTFDVTTELQYNFQRFFNIYKRGVLLKFKDTNNQIKTVKIDFNEFVKLKNIRGNEPHIRMRYLQLLPEPEKLNILVNYYPEHEFLFEMICHNINKVCADIFKTYKDTHVKHLYKIDNTHLFFQTLKQLHAQYKITNQPTTIADVFVKLKSLNPYVLKKLLGWI